MEKVLPRLLSLETLGIKIPDFFLTVGSGCEKKGEYSTGTFNMLNVAPS